MKTVEFKIPGLPPSINATYGINYHKKKCYMNTIAREFKFKVKLNTPRVKIEPGAKLEVEFEYHGNWINKNGTIKKKDGWNLDKVLCDAIFEKIGSDDSVAFKGSWVKVQSKEEFTIVKIKEM